MTDDTPRMIAVVENYIYIRKGIKVRIVFDDLMSMRKHLIMLNEAYNIAMNYKKPE
jgi:hypothetical protein